MYRLWHSLPLLFVLLFCEPVSGQGGLKLDLFKVGSGSILKTPDEATYISGEVVVLSAVADRYHEFDRWSDGTREPERTITIGASNRFVAFFTNSVALERAVASRFEKHVLWGQVDPISTVFFYILGIDEIDGGFLV